MTKIGKYFDDSEFFKPIVYRAILASGHQPGWHIDRELVDRLDKIREYFNSPVVIHRAYSSEQENVAVGSTSKYSFHLSGYACDFHVIGRTAEQVGQFIKDNFSTGAFGMIDDVSVHLDTRNCPLMEIKYS